MKVKFLFISSLDTIFDALFNMVIRTYSYNFEKYDRLKNLLAEFCFVPALRSIHRRWSTTKIHRHTNTHFYPQLLTPNSACLFSLFLCSGLVLILSSFKPSRFYIVAHSFYFWDALNVFMRKENVEQRCFLNISIEAEKNVRE